LGKPKAQKQRDHGLLTTGHRNKMLKTENFKKPDLAAIEWQQPHSLPCFIHRDERAHFQLGGELSQGATDQ
jgi:hypothetical protein